MFRYNFLPYRRAEGRLVLVMADPTDIPVVDELSLHPPDADPARGRGGLGDPGGPQAQPGHAARARAGLGVVQDPAAARRRERRRGPVDRQDPGRPVADHPPRRLDDLRRPQPPRLRHPHRDARQRGGDQVPHRRRPAAGDEADRQGAPLHDHQPHQGHVGARHRREAGAPGRPLPREDRRPLDRLPRVDHALRARRGRGHPHPRQGEPLEAVRLAAARRAGLRREGAVALPPLHPRALRDGARHRARRARARRRRSTPRSPRSRPRKTRSSRSRTRSSTSSRGSPRSR